jgi:Tol biopolymer transport system component
MTAAPFTVASAVWAAIAVGGPRVARQQLTSTTTCTATVDVSGDARFVAFESSVRLSPRDTNGVNDIYVLDRRTGHITLESVALDGTSASGTSDCPRLSHDGRVLVFTTIATNLVEQASGTPRAQVMRRDRVTGVTELVSRTPANESGNGWSHDADISDDGRVVVFQSTATDLVAGPDLNDGGPDIYLVDAAPGAITRVNVTSSGEQPRVGRSSTPRISGDGRYVVFASTAELDGPGGPQPSATAAGTRQVFLHDVWRHATRRISRTQDGRRPNGASYYPAISADGRVIAFVSSATDLADARRRPSQPAVFLYEAASARIVLVSRARGGGDADGASRHPAVSADGRYVVFSSTASNLVCTRRCGGWGVDLNLLSDIFRFDRVSQSVQQVSGRGGPEPWVAKSDGPALDATGRVVGFSSRHPIDDTDLHHDDDLFIEDLPDLPETGGKSRQR